MNCNYCGRENPCFIITVFNDDTPTAMCPNCAQYIGTCSLCPNGVKCEFETNPSPLPKQVQQTIRQGNMVAQTIVRNPERVKAFCTDCQCYNIDLSACSRQFGTCGKYNEYVPSPKPVEQNTPHEDSK